MGAILSKLEGFVDRSSRVLAIIAATIIGVITFVTLADAIGRDLGHHECREMSCD